MRPFGLDISDSCIRLAVLERRRQRLWLPIRAEIPVPSGLIDDGEILNPNQVSGLLKNLVKAAALKNRRAIVALPERHTFIKLISVPPTNSSSLRDQVLLEAGQHVPYQQDEMYFDWHSLNRTNSLGQTQVIIGAAPKTLVDTYLSVLHNSGIEPVSLEIESLAIVRATFRPTEQKATQILLDLGRSRSTLILLQDGIVQFTSTLRYAGRELNRYIAETLHITEYQAERAKEIFGLDPDRGKGILLKILAPHIDQLATKVREVESFFSEHFTDHRPLERIALTGSGALLRGIDRELSSRLKLPVGRKPSWVFTDLLPTEVDLQRIIGYAYTTVFGLCLQNFERHYDHS